MNAMADKINILLTHKEPLGSWLANKSANEGANFIDSETENDELDDELNDELDYESSNGLSPVEKLVTPEQAKLACEKEKTTFTDVRIPLSQQTQQALCDVNSIIQETGDEISRRVVDKIDKEYIQEIVEKAIKKFFNKFNKDFRVRLIDNMVNEQGKIFINQPVMKMQILFSVLMADESDPTTKHMFIIGNNIIKRALLKYLQSKQNSSLKAVDGFSHPIMAFLDEEFTASIAMDSSSGIRGLPSQVITAINQLPDVVSRGRGGKSKKSNTKRKSRKSKKSRKSRSRK
jgi:hypothetical protein